MKPIPVNLAVEDELSEVVIRHVVSHVKRGYAIGTAYGRNGFGYLKKTVAGWNNAAAGTPFILLTDLDQNECPLSLIESWLRVPRHPNLIFRVAVREVEAWLLADRTNFSRFLGVKTASMPADVEQLPDPKAKLVSLAAKSRYSEIRQRVAPKAHSTAKIGPDYNGCLATFVTSEWDVAVAAQSAPSLLRTVRKLKDFTPVWPNPAPLQRDSQ